LIRTEKISIAAKMRKHAEEERTMELSRRIKKDRIRTGVMIILVLAVCVLVLSACSFSPKKKALRVLIIPKFEVGRMSGDFPGEAQLFYEEYCPGCEEIEVPHMPPTSHFYFNDKNGVGILVTASGKTAAGLSLMAVLSSERYDYTDARIVSVGCGGGSAGGAAGGGGYPVSFVNQVEERWLAELRMAGIDTRTAP
jgi:purine nucleoside permease